MLIEQLLNFGRLHWYLLRADKLMEERMFEPHPIGKIYTPVRTPFGDEVQNDQINWWVFNRERDLPTFRLKTQVALEAAQVLKEAVQKLSSSYYDSMEKLNLNYETFGRDFEKEISIILEYVRWLHTRDELAPSVLFNYRTWGSTRMSDRILNIELNDLNNSERIERYSLVVLGLVNRYDKHIVDWVKMDLGLEIIENIDPENYPEKGIDIPVKEVDKRAAFEAVRKFDEYIKHLRDSLRNVMLDIERRELQDRLFTSDDFWRLFILKSAKSAKTEQKYWDFKQTLDMWHIKNEPAKSDKSNKFAEIVAGFANNKGGVIIVGVTDALPRQIVGLSGDSREIENYMKHTRNVINQYIPYDKDFVHLQQVNVPDQNGDRKLCLVIVIQQTVAGLSVMGVDGKSYTYPVREETGLVWKDQNTVGSKKIGTKSDNYSFLNVLQQFMNEEV